MKRYLVLENGDVFEGEAFGASGEVISEIVFTTAMTGYLETLTDKSYKGQAVVQTFPLIGNYGIIPVDREGPAPSVSAYIVREACEEPSNFRCEETLDKYLKDSGMDISFIFFTGVADWYRKLGYEIFMTEVFMEKDLKVGE